jgi:hypothetical protein
MSITMNMSSYEIENDSEIENVSREAEYSDEILNAGWNPEVDLVCQQLQLAQTTEQRDILATLTTEVAELFLRKMYSYQR